MGNSNLNIALAHDSLTQSGGAERVLEALHELYPQAPVFILVLDKKLSSKYKDWDIRTSWLQILYNLFPKLKYFLPLIPLAVSSLNFEGYNLVISSSSGFIKNISVPKKCIHINYCHTPARFLWSEPEYINQEVPGLIRPIAKLSINLMKKWDYKGAQRVNYFISNSVEVQRRIKLYYNRDSEVIYPFVDIEFWGKTTEKNDYFLLAGRLQAHKKNDIIVKIFNELGFPLHVVGVGRQEKYLKSIAMKSIVFLGKISDQQLRNEYSGALGYIYPQVEDFGLMPLEAAACGTASLAFGKGGSLETIISGATGEFFYSYDKEEIKRAVLTWDSKKYLSKSLRNQAEKFSKETFKQSFKDLINKQISI